MNPIELPILISLLSLMISVVSLYRVSRKERVNFRITKSHVDIVDKHRSIKEINDFTENPDDYPIFHFSITLTNFSAIPLTISKTSVRLSDENFEWMIPNFVNNEKTICLKFKGDYRPYLINVDNFFSAYTIAGNQTRTIDYIIGVSPLSSSYYYNPEICLNENKIVISLFIDKPSVIKKIKYILQFSRLSIKKRVRALYNHPLSPKFNKKYDVELHF